jgi:hypothetical protein
MGVPQFSNIDLLRVNNIIAKGSSQSGRDRDNRQLTDRLGRFNSPASLDLAVRKGIHGRFTEGALPISRAIEGSNKPNQQYLEKVAAIQEAIAEKILRKEAVLEEYRLRNEQQNGGYKKPKATTKPKAKTKAKTKAKPKATTKAKPKKK